MIDMIKILQKNNLAYETIDGVYFNVSNWKDYGKFSKLPMEEILSGARIEINENKKDPRDFALWVKCIGKHKDHTMRWDSPWGEGFPGWHIECSAMSTHYLGYNIDIHTGGVDHLFPHHECEIAQSEGCLSDKRRKKENFVRYWLHKNHVLVDNQKMSKSKNNLFTPKDLLDKGYSHREIRYLMISVHYRTQQNFTFEALDQAKNSLARIDEMVHKLIEIENIKDNKLLSKEWDDYMQNINASFLEYLEDDLNIPGCLSVIFDLVKEVNRKIDKSSLSSKEAKFTIDWLTSIDQVLFIMPWNWENKNTENIPDDVVKLAQERQKMKNEKNYAKSDEIRKKIEELGYMVIDKSGNYEIRKINL